MKRILVVVLMALSGAAMAQEIGREIPASAPPPPPGGSGPYDASYAAGGAPAAAAGPSTTHAGSFGIKAGFASSFIPAAPTGIAAGAAAAPTLGLRFIPIERLALSLDLGFALSLGNTLYASFSAGTSADFYLGSLTSALRPFITAGADFGKPLSSSSDDFLLRVNAGFGAEHWFTDHFSLNARLLIVLPIDLTGRGTTLVSTFVPALGAVFYF